MALNLNYEYWVYDVSSFGKIPVFCPFDLEKEEVVIGITVMSSECPGKLYGAFHPEGQEELEIFVEEHPEFDDFLLGLEVDSEEEDAN